MPPFLFAQLDALKDQPGLYLVAVAICLAFAGVAAITAWLDKRRANDSTECTKKIAALEVRVQALETSKHQARVEAFEGISETKDPIAKDRFRRIATILD